MELQSMSSNQVKTNQEDLLHLHPSGLINKYPSEHQVYCPSHMYWCLQAVNSVWTFMFSVKMGREIIYDCFYTHVTTSPLCIGVYRLSTRWGRGLTGDFDLTHIYVGKLLGQKESNNSLILRGLCLVFLFTAHFKNIVFPATNYWMSTTLLRQEQENQTSNTTAQPVNVSASPWQCSEQREVQDIDFQFCKVEFSLVGDKAVEHSMV